MVAVAVVSGLPAVAAAAWRIVVVRRRRGSRHSGYSLLAVGRGVGGGHPGGGWPPVSRAVARGSGHGIVGPTGVAIGMAVSGWPRSPGCSGCPARRHRARHAGSRWTACSRRRGRVRRLGALLRADPALGAATPTACPAILLATVVAALAVGLAVIVSSWPPKAMSPSASAGRRHHRGDLRVGWVERAALPGRADHGADLGAVVLAAGLLDGRARRPG